jgi:hypothetical protein
MLSWMSKQPSIPHRTSSNQQNVSSDDELDSYETTDYLGKEKSTVLSFFQTEMNASTIRSSESSLDFNLKPSSSTNFTLNHGDGRNLSAEVGSLLFGSAFGKSSNLESLQKSVNTQKPRSTANLPLSLITTNSTTNLTPSNSNPFLSQENVSNSPDLQGAMSATMKSQDAETRGSNFSRSYSGMAARNSGVSEASTISPSGAKALPNVLRVEVDDDNKEESVLKQISDFEVRIKLTTGRVHYAFDSRNQRS